VVVGVHAGHTPRSLNRRLSSQALQLLATIGARMTFAVDAAPLPEG
jgi:hypothetical protein